MKKEFIKVRKNTYAFFTDVTPELKSPAPPHLPMKRVFENVRLEIRHKWVVVRAQYWQCPITQNLCQDEWQVHCTMTAARKAVETGRPVLYYHTSAANVESAVYNVIAKEFELVCREQELKKGLK